MHVRASCNLDSGRANPLIELLWPISGIAWIPLGMAILGVGEALPTAIMFYGAFFPIVINADRRPLWR